MKKNNWQEFANYLDTNTKRIKALLVTHTTPDLDAVGSVLALSRLLQQKNILHKVSLDKGNYFTYNFLPGVDKLETFSFYDDFNTIIALDSATLERIQEKDMILKNRDKLTIINIDHHQDNTLFGDINIIEDISSVGELIFSLCEEFHWPIDEMMAYNIYASIIGDTGRFLYSNFTAKTLQVAEKCLERGFNYAELNQLVFENKKFDYFKIIRTGLENLKINWQKAYAYTYIADNDLDYGHELIDFIRKLEKIEVFIVFRKWQKGLIKISLRSKSHFDVAKFSAKFNGGGHKCAAGITIKGSLTEIMEKVIGELEKALGK